MSIVGNIKDFRTNARRVLEASGALSPKECKRFVTYMQFRKNRSCPNCGDVSGVGSCEAKFLRGFGTNVILGTLGAEDAKGFIYCCFECGNVFSDIT